MNTRIGFSKTKATMLAIITALTLTACSNNSSETINVQSIEPFMSISAVSISADITIVPSSRYALEALLPTGSGGLDWEVKDGKLSITANNGKIDFGSSPIQQHYIKIYCPENIEYSDIRLETSSGNASANNISAKSLSIESVSGNIALENTKISGEAILSSGSGDIKLLGDGKTEASANIKTVSGSISVDNAAIGRLVLYSSSGKIGVSGPAKSGSDISIKSGSGSVEAVITGIGADEASYDLSTVSGSIALDSVLQNSPAHGFGAGPKLKIETSSGNISVVFEK